MREFTPDLITSADQLPPNARVAAGTNFEGRHGKGGALMIHKLFNYPYGIAKGPAGRGYGIITKDLKKGMRSVTLDFIFDQVVDMMIFMENTPEEILYVTKFGSSLAGFSIEEIKSIFQEIYNKAYIPDNVILPKEYEVRPL